MTYLEQKRAQAQKMYQEEQKYWAEHAEEFKKCVERHRPYLLVVCRPHGADQSTG
jgi:import inner membrane translocase subunit TIM50